VRLRLFRTGVWFFDLCDFNKQCATAQQFLPLMLIWILHKARQRVCCTLHCSNDSSFFAIKKRGRAALDTVELAAGTCGESRCLWK
jgi:hypothetical protein